LPPKSGALPCRLHRKKTQITAIISSLDVNAPGQSTGVFCHQKRAAAHVRTDFQVIDAITGKDHLLHYKCRID
jgi:hypothetical protein